MIVTLDVGNTSIDVCTYKNGELKYEGKFFNIEDIKHILLEGDKVFVCSVKPSLNKYIKGINNNAKFLSVHDVNIKSEYESMETLGIDRLLFAYGVNKIYSSNAILVSAGTALVVDLLIEGTFKGGFITCGISTKAKALREKTEQLPEVKPEVFEGEIGKNTTSAIKGGIFLESFYFILSLKKRYESLFEKSLNVYITGGEGYMLKDIGIYDPLIIHKAMIELEKEK